MSDEIEAHENGKHWTVYERSELPDNIKTIMSIWTFKRKHFPDGRILKH